MLPHTRRKNSLDSQSAFCTHSAVCILHFVPSLHFVSDLHFVLIGIHGTNTVYFWLQLFAQHTIYHKKYLFVSQFDIFVLFRVNTLLSFFKNVDVTYNVTSNPPTPKKKTLAGIACFLRLKKGKTYRNGTKNKFLHLSFHILSI